MRCWQLLVLAFCVTAISCSGGSLGKSSTAITLKRSFKGSDKKTYAQDVTQSSAETEGGNAADDVTIHSQVVREIVKASDSSAEEDITSSNVRVDAKPERMMVIRSYLDRVVVKHCDLDSRNMLSYHRGIQPDFTSMVANSLMFLDPPLVRHTPDGVGLPDHPIEPGGTWTSP